MSEESSPSSFSRLERAISIYDDYLRGRLGQDQESILERHADLRDLLEPMLAEGDEEEDSPFPLRPENSEMPTRLGRYEIERTLGRGGMGIVYAATQDHPKRAIALKVMRADLLTPNASQRFEFEAQMLGRLEHPNIARIYEAGKSPTPYGDEPFLAMEMVEGISIVDFVVTGKLNVRDRLLLFAKVVRAIDYAHQRGVIHRDIKPSNILVDSQGEPKIVDFGIAKSTDVSERTAQLTEEGGVVGTLAYLSPEQASLVGDVDVRSDVYSLGLVLYEVLTGKAAFSFDEIPLEEALRRIRLDEAPSPRRDHAEIDEEVETIITKATLKDIDQRYGSAAMLAEDIDRYLDRLPILAKRPTASYYIKKFAQRHRSIVGLAGTSLLLILGLVFLLAASLHKANSLAQAEAKAHEDTRQTADIALSLSAGEKLDQLEARAVDLWPCRPETLPALNRWLADCQTILQELPEYRKSQETVRQDSLARNFGADSEWLQRNLGVICDRIEALDGESGLRREVARRLEVAELIEEKTVFDTEEAWIECIDSIASDERYDFLELVPQVGLVPLWKNDSGYWEFGLFETGLIPESERDLSEESCAIMVLIPSGEYERGAQSAMVNGPGYDPSADSDESPVVAMEVEAMFVGKHEVTQAQWMRVMGWNRSHGPTFETEQRRQHPVDSISWHDAQEFCRRLAVRLPTETEWEFAARAGCESPWPSGRADLFRHANLLDEAVSRYYGRETMSLTPEPWDDRHPEHAPVGSFLPNDFGLLDVLGNVKEWCANPYTDGVGEVQRVVRGGSYWEKAEKSRHANRLRLSPTHSDYDVGLRVVLSVIE